MNYEDRLQQLSERASQMARVHAGAETARRVIIGALEGPDAFRDSKVVVYLRDLLDALDGGSRKQGLLALGDTPDERIAKGREFVALSRNSAEQVAALSAAREMLATADHNFPYYPIDGRGALRTALANLDASAEGME